MGTLGYHRVGYPYSHWFQTFIKYLIYERGPNGTHKYKLINSWFNSNDLNGLSSFYVIFDDVLNIKMLKFFKKGDKKKGDKNGGGSIDFVALREWSDFGNFWSYLTLSLYKSKVKSWIIIYSLMICLETMITLTESS